MTERKLLSEFGKQLSKHGWWYKIPDSGKQERFAIEKPFDGIFARKGQTTAIEAKLHKKHTAWPLNAVEAHQFESLSHVRDHGWNSKILLFVVDKTKRPFPISAYIFSIDIIEDYEIRSNRKSIPIGEMQDLADAICVCNRNTGEWDFSEFLNLVE